MPFRSKNKKNRQVIESSRGRTPLTSYYRSRPAADGSSPFQRQAPKPQIRGYVFGFLDIIVLALLVFGLLYSLMVKPDPKVTADDYTFHSMSDYKKAAAAQLSRFNNRNKITFDESRVSVALRNQFPEVRAVRIELPLFSEMPSVTLSIDGPKLFLDSQGSRYVVDEAGRAVAKAASLPSVKSLPIVNDDSGFAVNPSRQVLSSTGVSFIDDVIKQCRIAGISISSMTLPPIPQEMDLKVKNQSYYVKFFLGGDAAVQTGQYLAASHHFNETGQQPSQYLDVRVEGKVFYK